MGRALGQNILGKDNSDRQGYTEGQNYFFGRSGWNPDTIICDTFTRPYDEVLAYMSSENATRSAHFIIGKDGRREFVVDYKNTAFIGTTSTDGESPNYYGKSTLPQVQERETNAGFFSYSIAFETSGGETSGLLTPLQYKAGWECIMWILTDMKERYNVTFQPDREHLVGHYQTNPESHPDSPDTAPHMAFPYDRYLGEIRYWMSGRDFTKPHEIIEIRKGATR